MRLRQARKTVLTEMCSNCGLPANSGARGSLTGWIFQEKRCRCQPKFGEPDDKDSTRISTSDQYEVLSTLGEGGMGTVYCVLDKTLNKKFAMKVLRKELASDREIATRFEREVKAAQSLNHPNLVSVYSHGVNPDGCPFLIMDLIEGETLAQRIARVGELPQNEAIDIFIQVVDAIAHAHERGILHRDLKPSNIMITSDALGHSLVKVVDLGIAKVIPTTGRDTLNLTRTGEIFGSPLYMSPEQCQAKPVDARCDIYSMGCVMYETLTGHPPFADTNPVKIILAHMYESPLPIRSNLISEGLQAAVMSCLQKLPNERYYQTMLSLQKDLQTLKDGKHALVELHAGKQRKSASFRRFFKLVIVPIALILLVFSVYVKDDFQLAIDIASGKGTNPYDFVLSHRTSDYNRPFFLLQQADISLTLNRNESDSKILEAISIFEKRSDFQNMTFACEQFLNRPAEDKRLPTSKVVDMLFRAISAPNPTPSRGVGVFAISAPPLLSRAQLGTSILRIARNYRNQGRYQDAQKLYDLSLVWGEQFNKRYPSLLSEALVRYSQFLKLRHDDEKSSQLLMQAFENARAQSKHTYSALRPEQDTNTFPIIGYEFLLRGDISNARRAFQFAEYDLGVAVTDALSNPSKIPDVKEMLAQLSDSEVKKTVEHLCEDADYKTIHATFEMLLPAMQGLAVKEKGNLFSSFYGTHLGEYEALYGYYLALCGRNEESDKHLKKALNTIDKYVSYKDKELLMDVSKTYFLEGDVAKAMEPLKIIKASDVKSANGDMESRKVTKWNEWDKKAVKNDQEQIDILNALKQSYADCKKVIPDCTAVLASKLVNEGRALEASALLEKSIEAITPTTQLRNVRLNWGYDDNDRVTKASLKVDLLRRLAHSLHITGDYDRALGELKKAMDLNSSTITRARMLEACSKILESKGDRKAAQEALDSSRTLMSTITREAITKHITENKALWFRNLDIEEYQWTKDLYKVISY